MGETGSGPGSFDEPGGLTIDSQGNLYVADIFNHRVQKFDSEGNFLAEVGGNGPDEGQFNEPWGVAVDSQDNVYVAEADPDQVRRLVLNVPAQP